MYKNIIFDADGTLLDTLPGILAGFNYAMERIGHAPLTAEAVKPFMGPALMDTFVNALGFSESDARTAVAYYREFYREKGFRMCSFYPGIEELLQKLKADGKLLCVATNKPQPYIDLILKERGYYDYFRVVAGASIEETSTDKTPLVRLAAVDPAAVMVGDRYVDITAAKNAGIASIGVLWGAALPGEFDRYIPTHVAASPEKVYNIVSLMKSEK